MKKYLILALVAIALVLVGCASSEEAVAVNDSGMPEWTYMDMSTQDVHYAVGYANMSNRANSIKRAQAEARNIIAEWVSTAVDEIITTYTNDAGSEGNRQAMDAFETLSKQRAQAVLSGSKQEDMFIDEEGGVYILMSIPVENVASQMYGAAQDAVEQTKFEKNAAAQEANNMMNAAIEKYFSNPSVTE